MERVSVLLARVRALACAVPIEHVLETMRPVPTEPLAGCPSYVAGLAVVRGAPTPVVDLAALLGLGGPGSATRYVSLRIGGRQVALAVDAVIGVSSLGASELEQLPPLLGEGLAVSAVGTHDRELLFVLQAARVVPESVWQALGAREVPPP